jgi:2,5-dioxopentanoate dehydrogenase
MPATSSSILSSAARTSSSGVHAILLGDGWQKAQAVDAFQAVNPKTGQTLPDSYPVSGWPDIDAALSSAANAARALRALDDADLRLAAFLEAYADGIDASADELVAVASSETGLPITPRLKAVELPRTTGQLRQAAVASRSGDWRRPTIDTKSGLRSCISPIGTVWVIGPNNFPFAFNGISGGDFAAAVAAGNPVIAKGHPLHPTTTRLLASIASKAASAADLPAGTVQLLYHMDPPDGLEMIADSRLKAVAFTGSRVGGLRLKAAADESGKLFFGEMSSINPVVLLPGALSENIDSVVDQFVTSILMGAGQFCTKPGIVLMLANAATAAFVEKAVAKVSSAPCGTLFSKDGRNALIGSIDTLVSAGATLLVGGVAIPGDSICVENTLLSVDGGTFLRDPHAFQTEAFGNASLIIVAQGKSELLAILETFEGNLTGTIYSATDGADDKLYNEVAAVLRPRVGRLVNDKMPTGVAVSAAMNHGGPFPATSQPHFTAVGIPASIARFTQLESFDDVRMHRLPRCLRDKNPTGHLWRQIDGKWTQGDV